jgi:hypothetical protein
MIYHSTYPIYLYGSGGEAGQAHSGSLRSAIFYDSNNTGYYVDPEGTTQLSYVLANNWFRPNGDCGLFFQSYGYGLWSANSGANSYGNATTYGAGRNGWQGWGIGSRHVFMSTGGDNVGVHDNSRGWIWYWNGSYTSFDYGYTQFAGSARSPIFYDSNNTAYYTDPASTSYMNAIQGDRYSVGNANPYDQVSNSPWYGLGQSNAAGPWGPGMVQLGGYYGIRTRTAHGVFDIGAPGWGTSWIYSDYNIGIAGQARATIYYDYSDTGYYADFNSTGDSIRAAGNIVAYYSDERLKKHLGKIENALEKVDQLEGFYYEANEVAQKLGYKVKREVGVSAQAVQRILPEIVTDAPISANYLTIDYERLVPLLIEAIKELKGEVETLKSRLH